MASEETLLAEDHAGERHATKNTLLSTLLSYMPGQEAHFTEAKVTPQDEPISPMESEDFAYPSNLESGPLHLQDDDDDYRDTEPEEGESNATKPVKPLPTPLDTSFSPTTRNIEGQSAKTTLEATPGSHWADEVDRGHFRANNVSTGSDLIQVTVEDLLISEEQVRTIKASGSYKKKPEHIQDHFQDQEPCRQEEQPVEKISNTSPASSLPTSPTSPRSITITATIRSADNNHLRRLSFETEGAPSRKNEEPKNTKKPTKPTTTTSTSKPAPNALTPAQQREAEADVNIQKAIELHENNRLVEATRYFRLAAQSENPLGQLMYGLSLRHGWGCRPNPTEAIMYLQRAAEFAMGELKELSPRPRPRPPPPEPENNGTSEKTSSSTDPSQQQYEQERQQASKSSHTNLRRMGSLDRRQATVTARKELVMALYELGMSYLKGWGVHKDKSVAFTYFKIAADLGDPDSQNETALCYYDGIGVDKDMFQSAKYYRLAAAQGASHLGNSWIWKPKYDQYCAAEAAATAVAKPPSTSFSTTTTTPTSRPRAQSDVNNHTSRSQGSNKSRSSSPAPAVASPQYTLSGIAAGLASVAATAGAIVPPAYSGSIRPMSSPPPSSLPTSLSSSSITSLPTLTSTPLLPVAPNTSRFSHHSSQSVGHLPLAAGDAGSLLAVQIGGFTPSSSSPLNSPPLQERKRHRWSLWGNKSSTALVTGKAN